MINAYIFRAYCYNVVDGDTVDCKIDVGFGFNSKQRLRLWGVNCPEKRSKDPDVKAAALMAEEFTAYHILEKDLMIQTYKDDDFGRYLAKVFIPAQDDTYLCLNDLLIEHGLAVPYMTNTELLS